MSTPEDEIRFAEAFNELGEAAELMVEPPAVAAIRGKVRRRRVTRVAVAGIAALALVAPASWALQQAATAEERDEPVIAEEQTTDATAGEESVKPQESTPPDEPSPESEETTEYDAPPTFDDLIGTTLNLPSFMPGHEMVDQACPVDGAVLEDGTTGGYMDGGGRIGLLEVVHARMMEDSDREFAVLFLGCRFGEAAAYQAVVLEQSEATGGWYVGAQLITSKADADSPYDLVAAPPGIGYGVLIGVAEHYVCCDTDPDELDYWVEMVSLDSDFAPVRATFDEGALPDLAIAVEATETDEAGVWTVQATIRNNSSGSFSGLYELSACADPAEIKEAEFPFGDCSDDGMTVIEDIGSLDPGEEHTSSWQVTVAPSSEWTDGAYIWFEIAPNTRSADWIARDETFADNEAFVEFTE